MGDTKKENKSPKPESKKKETSLALIVPLKVEIKFNEISALKMVPDFDKAGRLVLTIGFVAVTNQYEIFRLLNLLKQPHNPLYAAIGTSQSAMDFEFKDVEKEGAKITIIKSEKALPKGSATIGAAEKKTDKKTEAINEETEEPVAIVKLHDVHFNHIPEEKLPYGVTIDFLDERDRIHTVAGRGKNETEAVISGIQSLKIFPEKLKEPFEYSKALEEFDPSPATYKLIRVIEVGSFDKKEDDNGSD